MYDDQMLLRLSDVAARDRSLAGSKAAALAVLSQANFPVPDGMILTTLAFGAFAATGEPAAVPLPTASPPRPKTCPPPPSPAQYETVLNVRGPAAIEDAVRRCWASLYSPGVS